MAQLPIIKIFRTEGNIAGLCLGSFLASLAGEFVFFSLPFITIGIGGSDKDLGLILSAAEAKKIPLLAGSLTRQLMEASKAAGLGDRDWSVVSKVIRRLAGEDV